MSNWKRIERSDLNGWSTEEVQNNIQANVSEFSVYLETYEGDLNELEKEIIAKNEEYTNSLSEVEYELPNGTEFDGTKYTGKEIANNIVYFLNKMEVKWTETLGMYEMVKFWKSSSEKIKYSVFDSILRVLQTLQFTGTTEWKMILAINEYMKQMHDLYIKDTIYIHYGAYLHDAVVKLIEGDAEAHEVEEVEG